MKLGLKYTPPVGFWKQAFHHLTKYRLVTRYPHAAIIIGDKIMHSTLSGGLHDEDFEPEGWDLFDVPQGNEAAVLKLFSELEGTPYDAWSLLAFVLPWRVSDASRLYCYEWCLLALTGQMPTHRVTPEDLLAALLLPATDVKARLA